MKNGNIAKLIPTFSSFFILWHYTDPLKKISLCCFQFQSTALPYIQYFYQRAVRCIRAVWGSVVTQDTQVTLRANWAIAAFILASSWPLRCGAIVEFETFDAVRWIGLQAPPFILSIPITAQIESLIMWVLKVSVFPFLWLKQLSLYSRHRWHAGLTHS